MRLPDVASIPAMPSFHDEISIAIEEQPTTPPNISHSNVQPEGTSLTGKQASSLALNSTHMDPEERLTATRFDTAGWVIESISAQEFLDHYLPQAGPPSAPERPDPKEQMTKLAQPIKREIQLYDKQNVLSYMGALSPTDNSMRPFTALSQRTQKLVFLKDIWPVIISGQLPEHEIYEKLRENNVTNIARLMEGADILEHKIITHAAVDIFFKESCPKIRHYRSVLGNVGHDLRTFSSVKQLVKAIHDATIAYDEAFFGAGVLHGDISTGNIIMLADGTGLLVDWDFCKDMNSAPESEERAMECAGTWQFAAARLLLGDDGEPPQNREDDLESFYHVLNWMALRHTSHSFSSEALTSELQRIFDYSSRLCDGRAASALTKISEVLSGTSNKFAAFKNQPLAELLETIRQLLAVRYQRKHIGRAEQRDIDRYQTLMKKLRKREEFTSLFAKALTSDQDWVSNGARVDHKLVDLHVRYIPLY